MGTLQRLKVDSYAKAVVRPDHEQCGAHSVMAGTLEAASLTYAGEHGE